MVACMKDKMSGEPATDRSEEPAPEPCQEQPRASTADRFIIEGIREDTHKVFRPSNWAERVSAVLASFGPDHKLRYSEYAQPCVIEGTVCLIVTKGLEQSDPDAYDFIMRFARENHLRIMEDRRGDNTVELASPPADEK